jgi:hypothetical protein
MTRIMRRMLAASIGAMALAAGGAGATPLSLSHPAALARDNAALPRITAPATPGTAKVNAALARLDSHWRAFMAQCRTDGGRDAYTGRTVKVAMASPRILSLTIGEEAGCGGAYPNSDVMGLAYDLDTGRPLDWTRLLPARLVDSASVDTLVDGTKVGAVVSPRLHALYLAALTRRNAQDAAWKSECAEPMAADDMSFQLWPDAAQGGVAMLPFSLPHALAACGEVVVLPTAALRSLGVDKALLDVIDAAHAGR